MLPLSAAPSAPGSLASLPAADPAKNAYSATILKRLTSRQSFFVRLVADGKSHAEAYRVAYCKPQLKAPAAAHGAYRIAIQPSVKAHLDAIHLDPPGPLLTLQQRLELIAGIILSPNSTRTERLRAAELYTKIAGDGAPEILPWDEQPSTVQTAVGEASPGFTVRVDIFKNAPSRMKSVLPLHTRLQSTGIPPAAPAGNGNGNGNGNGHH